MDALRAATAHCVEFVDTPATRVALTGALFRSRLRSRLTWSRDSATFVAHLCLEAALQ